MASKREGWRYAAVGWAGAQLVGAWHRTLRVQTLFEDPAVDPRQADSGYIYCFWHEGILMLAAHYARRNIHVLVSESRDGEYITRVILQLGYGAVRGSSTRGAVRAVRELARASPRHCLAITPDGPAGPRREFQPGAVYLASRTGLAIVPIGMAFSSAWRANSWDRFVIPRPFSRMALAFGAPLIVPADADAAELARFQQLATEALAAAHDRAERALAPAHRRFDPPHDDTRRRLGPKQAHLMLRRSA